MNTADSRNNSSAKISLSDPGYVPAAGSRKNSISTMDSESANQENPSPVYITAYGDLKPNRESFVSINEAEHGWSSSANGVRSPQNKRQINARPAKQPYLPPFAPRHDSLEGQAANVVPTLPPVPTQEPKLSRGRSLRETITGVIRGKSTSRRQPRETVVVEESDEKDDKNAVEEAPRHYHRPGSSPGKEGFMGGIVRKMSRRTNSTPARRPATYRRRSMDDIDIGRIPTREELDNIPLYAAPAAAKVANAPMLSSYAPRPPLRTRANTTDNVLTLQRSITVREARLAYAKSLKDKRRAKESPASTVGSTAGDRLSKPSRDTLSPEDGLQMKGRSRRSRPPSNVEGWATATEIIDDKKA